MEIMFYFLLFAFIALLVDKLSTRKRIKEQNAANYRVFLSLIEQLDDLVHIGFYHNISSFPTEMRNIILGSNALVRTIFNCTTRSCEIPSNDSYILNLVSQREYLETLKSLELGELEQNKLDFLLDPNLDKAIGLTNKLIFNISRSIQPAFSAQK